MSATITNIADRQVDTPRWDRRAHMAAIRAFAALPVTEEERAARIRQMPAMRLPRFYMSDLRRRSAWRSAWDVAISLRSTTQSK